MNDSMTQNRMNIDHSTHPDLHTKEKFKSKVVQEEYDRKSEFDKRDPDTWDARKTAWQPEIETRSTDKKPRKSRSRHDSSSGKPVGVFDKKYVKNITHIFVKKLNFL